MPLKGLLQGILEYTPKLSYSGKTSALKAYIMILLHHGKGTTQADPEQDDHQFLLDQIKTIVYLLSENSHGFVQSPFLRNLAGEALMAFTTCTRLFSNPEQAVLEALEEATGDRLASLYNTFCDRLEMRDEPYLSMVEKRNSAQYELRLPYLDKLEMQAISSQQK